MKIKWCALGRDADGRITAFGVGADGSPGESTELSSAELPEFVRRTEAEHAPRWVWNDTTLWVPGLLERGVRVTRCHDLRLSHAILRRSA